MVVRVLTNHFESEGVGVGMKGLEMNILRKAQDGEVEGCLRKAFLDATGKATPLGLATKMMGCKHQKRL